MQVELARVVGVPLEAIRRVTPVDWSVHDGWYRPGIGYEVSGLSRMWLSIMTLGLAPGTTTSTVALTDDALVIAKPSIFDARYSLQERIALADVEAVTLFEDGWVVLRRRLRGERRDYLRVLGGDPWLAGTPETRSEPYRADLLAREIRARIAARPARWRPPANGAEKLVALLTPLAPPVASVLPPPGSASKEPLQGSEQIAKAPSDAAQGLGMLSAPAGLALGLAAVVTYAAGAAGGAVHGSLEERSDPTARAARDRAEAVQRALLPPAGPAPAANGMLRDALAARIGSAGGLARSG
jgi:hypothetical protein